MVFTQDEVTKILQTYNQCSGNSEQAGRYLSTIHINVTPPTIRKKWKEAGYELSPRGGKRTPLLEKNNNKERDEIIIGAYQRYHGNPNLASKSLPYASITIKRVWESKGLQINYSNGGLENLIDS